MPGVPRKSLPDALGAYRGGKPCLHVAATARPAKAETGTRQATALKADLTEIDRRIQQSLKPIEESEGKEAEEDNDVCRERHDTAEELPKEDNTAARIPSRLRQIADASGGRIVIAGVGSPPENGPAKKGIKM